eukprot:264958_1
MSADWCIILINGYIHEIASEMRYIPLDVIQLCFTFYKVYPNILLLLKCIRDDYGLCIADIANDINWGVNLYNVNPKKNKRKKNKKHKTNNHKHNKTDCTHFLFNMSSICYHKNFKISKLMHQKITQTYCRNNDYFFNSSCNEYNVIFKCHQNPNRCNALLFHQKQLNKLSGETINAFNWRLPSLPNISHNSLIYHSRHGLISIGGEKRNKCWILNVNEDNTHKQWNSDTNIIQNMINRQCCLETTCILSNDELKLFVIGGMDIHVLSSQKSVSMFDFENNNWRILANMNYCKAQSGAFYDSIGKRIYSGGGYGSTGPTIVSAVNRMEFYDINKNRWYKLCDTVYTHAYNPLLWMDNDNILYIASIGTDFVEFIDLRMNMKMCKWNTRNDLVLSDIFDCKAKITGQFNQRRILK